MDANSSIVIVERGISRAEFEAIAGHEGASDFEIFAQGWFFRHFVVDRSAPEFRRWVGILRERREWEAAHRFDGGHSA